MLYTFTAHRHTFLFIVKWSRLHIYMVINIIYKRVSKYLRPTVSTFAPAKLNVPVDNFIWSPVFILLANKIFSSLPINLILVTYRLPRAFSLLQFIAIRIQRWNNQFIVMSAKFSSSSHRKCGTQNECLHIEKPKKKFVVHVIASVWYI